jgi:hypothetical protein
VDVRAAHSATRIGVIAVATARQVSTRRIVGCSSHQVSAIVANAGCGRPPHGCSARVRAAWQPVRGRVRTRVAESL